MADSDTEPKTKTACETEIDNASDEQQLKNIEYKIAEKRKSLTASAGDENAGATAGDENAGDGATAGDGAPPADAAPTGTGDENAGKMNGGRKSRRGKGKGKAMKGGKKSRRSGNAWTDLVKRVFNQNKHKSGYKLKHAFMDAKKIYSGAVAEPSAVGPRVAKRVATRVAKTVGKFADKAVGRRSRRR